MKLKLSVLSAAVALAACGGGGGGGSNTGTTTTTTATTTTTTATASGSTINGTVFNDVTQGAVITAYNVMADGSNGAAIGTSAVTGTDGRFTITLTGTPTGFVRLVATGGTYVSEADSTTQENGSLELVTPSVSSTANNFVITPITHFASRAFHQVAAGGADSNTAFATAMNRVKQLSGSNQPLKGDAAVDTKLLQTVPGSSGDTALAYLDMVKAVEWFGVKYDMPSKTVIRAIGKLAEGNWNILHTDGTGADINVGNWVGSTYDESQTRTLNTLVGVESATAELIYRFNQQFYEVEACADATKRPAYFARYPEQSNAFNDPAIYTPRCNAVTADTNALLAKRTTNKRAQ